MSIVCMTVYIHIFIIYICIIHLQNRSRLLEFIDILTSESMKKYEWGSNGHLGHLTLIVFKKVNILFY